MPIDEEPLTVTERRVGDVTILDLKGKATVMNRELFNRAHFLPVAEVDPEEFEQLIDAWAIEFAEVYAARSQA